jgi:PKD repeat protein
MSTAIKTIRTNLKRRRRTFTTNVEGLEDRQMMSVSHPAVIIPHAMVKPHADVAAVHKAASHAHPVAHHAQLRIHAPHSAPAPHGAAKVAAPRPAANSTVTTITPTSTSNPSTSTPTPSTATTSRAGSPSALALSLLPSNSIYSMPPITFGQSSYSGTVSDATGFQANVTFSGVDPSTVNYVWQFGDGSPAYTTTGMNSVYHTYGTPGNYTASVIAVTPNGITSTMTTVPVSVSMKAIPLLSQWQSQMITFGKLNAAALADPTATNGTLLGETYYDAERVFYQIANYTGDSSWITAALNAQKAYRDYYVLPNNGMVPGYWDFAKGLEMNYLLTGDPLSKQAVFELASNAAFASSLTPIEWSADSGYSREVAYNIDSKLAAQALGAPYDPKLPLMVDQALGDIDQWFISKTASSVKPFMVGLTCEALINWYNTTGDSRVLPAIQTAMDSIWATLWNAPSQAFVYNSVVVPGDGGPTPAPDLNLLIAPAYAWLYHMTGISKYRDIGDQVFAGGVNHAWLYNNKQFDQNYRWSIDFVNWMSAAPLVSNPTSGYLTITPAPNATGAEGSPATIALGSFTDTLPNSAPWNLTVDWGDGTTPTSMPITSQGVLPTLTHSYANHGTWTITEKLTNALGATTTKTELALIADVAPTVMAASPITQNVAANLPVSMTVQANDPSPTDQATGFTYTWNFGDGSAPVSGFQLRQASHTYAQAGTYQISVTATDSCGNAGAPLTMTVNSIQDPTIKAIPNLALWQSKLLSAAQTYANNLVSNKSFTGALNDAVQLFYQLADYTGQSSWLTAAQNAKIAYRDGYVLPNYGYVSFGYDWAAGLATDFLRTGDQKSASAVIALETHAAYTASCYPISSFATVNSADSLSWSLLTELAAAQVGVQNSARISQLVGAALGDLNQWFVAKTAAYIDTNKVALTLQALTHYADQTGDLSVVPAVQNALDSLWAATWNSNAQAFNTYDQSCTAGTPTPSPTLNMILAPVYAWVYDKTGNTTYRDEGDAAFASGVQNANTGSESSFAQAYVWSFDFVKLRSKTPTALLTPPTTTPTA